MTITDDLIRALWELNEAVAEMVQPTEPPTPLPRPRYFEIVPGLVWPCPGRVGMKAFFSFGGTPARFLASGWARIIANAILEACADNPGLVLRALRRIQAAAAWCRARAEGRQRAAQEIMRQRAPAAEILEAEVAMLALAGEDASARGLIADALAELGSAALKMVLQTSPKTSLPRPRLFELAPGVVWPHPELAAGGIWDSAYYELAHAELGGHYLITPGAADVVLKACADNPREILRSLQRIRAATAWCRARAAGRERAAREILRQQGAEMEAVRAMADRQKAPDDGRQMLSAVLQALDDLRCAAERMVAEVKPLPRPRVFGVTEHVAWPYPGTPAPDTFFMVGRQPEFYIIDDRPGAATAARAIVADCGGQPRRVLRALRRIQAAAAWCRARVEGRERAAREVSR